MRTFSIIAIPGVVTGLIVAGIFSLISIVDGIGDLRLVLFYVIFFLLFFLPVSFLFALYAKLIKTEPSTHNQFYLLHIFLLGVMLMFTSSYAMKLIPGWFREQPFYGFPRILTLLLPLFLFLGLSRVSKKSWKNRFIAITLVLMAVWTIGALWVPMDFWAKNRQRSHETPNILLLTIESLRHDHLGTTSEDKVKTKILDSLIDEGLFFDKFFVQAPYTTASVATLATGCYPFNHGAREFGQKPGADFFPFVDLLIENGYTTRLDVSFFPELFSHRERPATAFSERIFSIHYVVSAWLGNIWPEFFGAYAFSTSTPLIETARLIRAIRINRKKKWFFWTHFVSNCHWPYESPPQFTRMYTRPQQDSKLTFSKKDIFDLNTNPERIDKDTMEHLDMAYSAEVSCIDTQIGFIMNQLEFSGLMEDTVMIISSDHGECLGEDGFVGHGKSLKDNLIHVPLILFSKNPDYVPVREKNSQLVEEVDLAPTILDLAGVKYERTIFDGRSILGLLEHDTWEKKSVYSEFVLDKGRKFFASLRTEDHKLVWDSEEDRFYLYDLSQDPLETNDVSHDYPIVVEKMKEDMLERTGKSAYAELKPDLVEDTDEDMRKKMKALGYIK